MENLTLTNCLLAFLGVLIYVLFQLKTRKKEKKTKFSAKFWLKDNIIDMILSLSATLAILLMADNICHYFGITYGEEGEYKEPALQIISFCAGLFNQSIIRWLMKAVRKKFGGGSQENENNN